jgi:hypothetical protein
MKNIFSGAFLLLVFFGGIILGYRGLSLREIGDLAEKYAEEGDKYINRKLNEVDKIRRERKKDYHKQAYQLYKEERNND